MVHRMWENFGKYTKEKLLLSFCTFFSAETVILPSTGFDSVEE